MRAATLPVVFLLLFGLGACAGAGPTPYGPAERPGGQGYSEERLDADRYRITVAGNALTPRERVEDYLLYRAAELTLQEGFDHFRLLERQTDSDTVRYQDSWGGPAWGPGWAWSPGWGGYYGGYYGGRARHGVGVGISTGSGRAETRYETSALVRLRPGPVGGGEGPAYDAREVIERLQPVVRPPA